ncbi:MAG: hypothetical protein C4524_01780 [Candidatus Zixiibacteriota bacterium]|nr:MAG: hypothetical protein C4524_01780 [candidate division Zixibacteria bacterium]
MQDPRYKYLRHLGAALLAGLLFSLLVGFIFSLKMIIINESTHQFRYAYPFALNFIPLYLLLGLAFGLAVGVLGGLLLRDPGSRKGLGMALSLGAAFAGFLVVFLIFGVPLGPIAGMFLALLILVFASGLRPPLSRLYFSLFFTAVLYNYSWQWVRQHFIINPLMPVDSAKALDFVFTLIWALAFLVGYRLFLKGFFRLPVKVLYGLGTAGIVGLLLAGGVYYLALPEPAAPASAEEQQVDRRPTDVKVVLVGIDGLWWKILDPMIEEGRLPTFQKLVEQGSFGPLETIFPTFSATIWSSISTGKGPEKHGVTSFLVWKFPWTGYTLPCFITPKITAELNWFREDLITVAPMTNQFLETTPIWEILSDHGVSVGAVNWWLSYPATPVNGFVVTDHCLYNKEYIMENFKEKEGQTKYDLYPPEMLDELMPFSRTAEDLSEEEIRRFINVESPEFLNAFYAIDTYDYLNIDYEASMFKYSYPEDATFAVATRYLIAEHQPEFLCVYLDGMDSMQHQYLKYHFADQHPDKLIPENLARYRDLIANYYVYMDEVVASFMEVADSNTVFMIVSDHGFDDEMMVTGHYNHTKMPPPDATPDDLANLHPGVLICAGPGIRENYRMDGTHVYDVTPTVLALLGLPPAEDFDGRVLDDMMLDPPADEALRTYDTGRRADRRIMQSDMDEAYKDKLRALGYTQ